MARLTDRELELIQKSRVSFHYQDNDHQVKVPEMPAALVTRPSRPETKPAAPKAGLLQSILGSFYQRRTAAELNRLSDHLLADIGVERGEIPHLARQLVTDQAVEPAQVLPLYGTISAWWQRRQAIRDLSALDDRTLADIGLQRGDIPAAVDGLRHA